MKDKNITATTQKILRLWRDIKANRVISGLVPRDNFFEKALSALITIQEFFRGIRPKTLRSTTLHKLNKRDDGFCMKNCKGKCKPPSLAK
jgi:hypothetical protein